MGPRVSGFFFKYVVHLVFLFGAETWVVNPCMGRVMGGFQDGEADMEEVTRKVGVHLGGGGER